MTAETRGSRESLPIERTEKIEQAMEELRRDRRAKQRKFLLLFAGAIAVFAATYGAGMYAAHRGSDIPPDGVPAVARIDRASDGSCLVGVKRSHCYALQLTVYKHGESPYRAKLDVNVQDRWASRVQPGSFVTVAVDKHDSKKVYLDIEAFSNPAPAPPGSTGEGT